MLAKPVIVVDDIHAHHGIKSDMAFFLAKALDVFHQEEKGAIICTSSEASTASHLRTCMRSHMFWLIY